MKRQTIAPTLCSSRHRVVLRSDDGSIEFRLAPSALGVCVERVQRHPENASTVQVMVFADGSIFDRWCDADPLRFVHPLVYLALKRNGHDLFGQSG